ncbi:RNA-binding S4 domain-containing protein [Dietzia psychralcaliphila]|uniref:RNA-binding S4 domain-containing protein n=1 Tax=Dietzia psychralcaliphila TaxID=139021 RepID=UPI000D323369|nr:RNA-binding S4 domain-containing protein [Dietzia psychralcaliphila]PTM87988.1 ribosome-associated protein YbcJ (S4-like RNA binding protein) [Dietzia psychralcaliphila]
MSRHIAGRGRTARVTPPVGPPVDDVECDLSSKLTLGQFLKLASLLDSGAEAKDAVAAGAVSVNGEVDVRRGRGLVDGDVVAFGDRAARVVAGDGQGRPE